MTLNKSEKAPLLKKPILLLYFHPFFNNLFNPFPPPPPPLRQANKTHSTHLPSTKKTGSKLCILNSFLKNDDPLQTSFLQNHKIFKKNGSIGHHLGKMLLFEFILYRCWTKSGQHPSFVECFEN